MCRRRRGFPFIGLVLLVLLAPAVAHAQARVHSVGVVLLGGPYTQAVDGLRDGLRELGFEEGKQYALLIRDTSGDLRAVSEAARQLEREKVDLIFAVGSSVAVTSMKATRSVPIVFNAGADPVAAGLVSNYGKPGGRVTGVGTQSRELAPKRLQLLKEIVPSVRRIVTFYNPNNPTRYDPASLRDAARSLRIQLVERSVRSVEELREALHALRPGDVDAIFYVGDAMIASQARLLIDTAMTKRLATMLQEEGSTALGALASYGVSFKANGRLAAKHVHRILQGARAGDLPVEQLGQHHLSINLKTAKAIGVTVPQSVLARADEIIQ